jgi:hypothetical protein
MDSSQSQKNAQMLWEQNEFSLNSAIRVWNVTIFIIFDDFLFSTSDQHVFNLLLFEH